jgi:hypothetical protein
MKLPYEHKKLRAPNDKKRRPLSFGSSTGLGKNKGDGPFMQKSQGLGKEPCHGHQEEGEGYGTGVVNSQPGKDVIPARKEKPNERQIAHFVPRKRKGLIAKDSPAIEL